MRKKRHAYTPEEKVHILKRHLIDRVAISDLCDEYHLQPALFYSWQKQFFEKGALVFAKESEASHGRAACRIHKAARTLPPIDLLGVVMRKNTPFACSECAKRGTHARKQTHIPWTNKY